MVNLELTFKPAAFSDYGNAYLVAEPLTINGTPFHVQAYLCHVDNGETKSASEHDFSAEIEAYLYLNNCAPTLTKIPGFEGEYLILIYPYGA